MMPSCGGVSVVKGWQGCGGVGKGAVVRWGRMGGGVGLKSFHQPPQEVQGPIQDMLLKARNWFITF
ncbi:hypothetical protein CsSME_00034972 [Camellia sinensis var. sinensis]